MDPLNQFQNHTIGSRKKFLKQVRFSTNEPINRPQQTLLPLPAPSPSTTNTRLLKRDTNSPTTDPRSPKCTKNDPRIGTTAGTATVNQTPKYPMIKQPASSNLPGSNLPVKMINSKTPPAVEVKPCSLESSKKSKTSKKSVQMEANECTKRKVTHLNTDMGLGFLGRDMIFRTSAIDGKKSIKVGDAVVVQRRVVEDMPFKFEAILVFKAVDLSQQIIQAPQVPESMLKSTPINAEHMADTIIKSEALEEGNPSLMSPAPATNSPSPCLTADGNVNSQCSSTTVESSISSLTPAEITKKSATGNFLNASCDVATPKYHERPYSFVENGNSGMTSNIASSSSKPPRIGATNHKDIKNNPSHGSEAQRLNHPPDIIPMARSVSPHDRRYNPNYMEFHNHSSSRDRSRSRSNSRSFQPGECHNPRVFADFADKPRNEKNRDYFSKHLNGYQHKQNDARRHTNLSGRNSDFCRHQPREDNGESYSSEELYRNWNRGNNSIHRGRGRR